MDSLRGSWEHLVAWAARLVTCVLIWPLRRLPRLSPATGLLTLVGAIARPVSWSLARPIARLLRRGGARWILRVLRILRRAGGRVRARAKLTTGAVLTARSILTARAVLALRKWLVAFEGGTLTSG